jgi:hypothetical protein
MSRVLFDPAMTAHVHRHARAIRKARADRRAIPVFFAWLIVLGALMAAVALWGN